ncbi:MAG: hypothetical protein RI894_1139, partial [Bacteroidota bacterium]
MQHTIQPLLFDVPESAVSALKVSKKQVFDTRNSTAKTKSRYSNIKKILDTDQITNNNWIEINTQNVAESAAAIYFMDLFSGAGGISTGAKLAGLQKAVSVEIDKDASATIRLNFPESVHFQKPIQEITETEFKEAVNGRKISVIFGGPPCQGFSVAGLRDPNDPRNQLFKEYVRTVKIVQPDFVVLENVPGILTMEKGRVYREILQQFADIGYPNMSVRILEAATFGVPQLRTRAIFIGNKLGIKNPYPMEIFNKTTYNSIESAIDDLKLIPRFGAPNHEWTQHSPEFEARIAQIPPGGSLYETFRDAFKRQHLGVPSMTVKENHGGCHVHYELNRVLSAREMARLQTFPDDFFYGQSQTRL